MTTQNETLYNLTSRMIQLAAFIENSENVEEMAEAIAETQELLEMSFDEKLDAMMTVRQNKLARVGALKDEINRLKGLIESEEKGIAKVEKYAQDELTRLGYSYKDKKLSKKAVGKFNLTFKKLPPILEITDASKIPPQYMNIPKPAPAAPDKKELLDLMKQKAELLHGKNWTKEIDSLDLAEFGIKMVNNNQKFEVK